MNENYEVSSADIKMAESHMTDDQKTMSGDRETTEKTFDEIRTLKPIETVEALEKVEGKYAGSGETYAPVNGDILRSAVEAFEHMHADAEKNSADYVDELTAKLIEFGDKDGEMAVLLERTTRMGKGKGPMQGGHSSLYLGQKWLESGTLPDKVVAYVKTLREEERISEGNDDFSIHFVGRTPNIQSI